MRPCDDAQGNDYDSHIRYQTVINTFSSGQLTSEGPKKAVEAAAKLLKGGYGFLCQYDDCPDFETVWSSIFDLNSLAVYHTEGDPRKTSFVRDNRLRNLKFNLPSAGSVVP